MTFSRRSWNVGGHNPEFSTCNREAAPMIPNLNRCISKTILVSIPSLSGDTKCRPHKLIGIELIGLWLESADLSTGFLTDEHRSHASARWSFFVPFTQIACVAVGSLAAATPGGDVSTGPSRAPASSATQAAARGSSSTAGTVARRSPRSKEA